MTLEKNINKFTKIYGEKYRRLIAEALFFLTEHEPTWNLNTKINKAGYLKEIMKKVIKDES